jgi:hypothetical protein
MQELKKFVKVCKDAQDEARRLNLMEADAKKLIEAAADEDIAQASVQEKVSRAKIMLDLVAARRKRIKNPPPEMGSLKDELRARSVEWNQRVAQARAKFMERLVAATLPFFLDKERDCQRFWKNEVGRLPAYNRLCRLGHDMPSSGDPASLDWPDAAGRFIAHVGRSEKALSLE